MLSTQISVDYRVQVIEAETGAVVSDHGQHRNLTLDVGMDALGTANVRDCNKWLILGTGALITKRASGAITITAAGGTLTASAGFFAAADVGRILKLESGQEYRITAFTSATQVTSSNATGAGPSAGTIHYVNITALITEASASNTRESGPTAAWNASTGTLTFGAVHLGPILASGSRTVTELGWAFDNGGGSRGALFGVAALAPSVTYAAGQRLRVEVAVQFQLGPLGPLAFAGTGLAAGTHGIQYFAVDNLGYFLALVFPNQTGSGTEIYADANAAAITAPAAWPGGYYPPKTFTASTKTLNAYTPGTFTRTMTFAIPDTAGAGTIQSIYIENAQRNIYRALLSAPIAKTSANRIDGTITWSWGRTLVN